jgi:anti-sigma factor RsiW
MTGKNSSGELNGVPSMDPAIPKDDWLVAAISAYLDGELSGSELAEFEAVLKNSDSLAREVEELRLLQLQLTEMAADILLEPVPEHLLAALSRPASEE